MDACLRLAELIGEHLTDVDALTGVASHLEGIGAEVVEISLEGVATLSPSFATALLLMLRERKESRGTILRLTSLSKRHREVLLTSQSTLNQRSSDVGR